MVTFKQALKMLQESKFAELDKAGFDDTALKAAFDILKKYWKMDIGEKTPPMSKFKKVRPNNRKAILALKAETSDRIFMIEFTKDSRDKETLVGEMTVYNTEDGGEEYYGDQMAAVRYDERKGKWIEAGGGM